MGVCYVIFKEVIGLSPGYVTVVNWECDHRVAWFGPSESYLMIPPEGWNCD